MIEDEMVGWHHQLNGHEFEQALGVGDGQGSLACCSPWDSPGKNTGMSCHALLQGDLPDPGIKPPFLTSPALAGRFFTSSTTWEAHPYL